MESLLFIALCCVALYYGGKFLRRALNIPNHLSATPPSQLPSPPPLLPPPIAPPTAATAPIKGIMRVDVTRTSMTVDVWILLSEEAKFIVQANNLQTLPVEENFDGLKEHMETFTRQYDYVDDDIDSSMGAELRNDPGALRIYKEVADQQRQQRRRGKPEAIKQEAERYKREHTVTLREYLDYPHRHVINFPYEANLYIEQLEKKYLPLIKAAIDLSSSSRHVQTKTYEL